MRSTHSLIKPFLLRLTGSGHQLDGVVVERAVERPHSPYREIPSDGGPPPGKHILVLPRGPANELEWRMGGTRRRERFGDQDVILNPTGLFTAPRWERETEIVLLAVDAPYLNRVAEEAAQSASIELVPTYHFQDALLRQLLLSLINEYEQDSPADLLYAESLIHRLLTHLIRHYSVEGMRALTVRRGLSPHKLRRVTEYVHAHLSDPLSLDEIADVAGYSPSHFISLFKRVTGQTPHQYVIAQRIERASHLLTRSDASISMIALQSGFADQSHLTRLMRRHTGLTPKMLRDG